MPYRFDCRMCDGSVSGQTKEEVVEKIKQHGAEVHGLDPMPQEEASFTKILKNPSGKV